MIHVCYANIDTYVTETTRLYEHTNSKCIYKRLTARSFQYAENLISSYIYRLVHGYDAILPFYALCMYEKLATLVPFIYVMLEQSLKAKQG